MTGGGTVACNHVSGREAVENNAEYDRIADFSPSLTEEQLDLKAQVPVFQDSPLRKDPRLVGMIEGVGSYHVQFHTDYLREVLKDLGC